MPPGDRDSGLGLAEVVAAFSLATDLGLGQPMEHVLRSWAIATRLGEHMGIESETAAVAVLRGDAGVGGMCGRHPGGRELGSATTSRSGATATRWIWPGLPMFKFALGHVGAGQPGAAPAAAGRRPGHDRAASPSSEGSCRTA